MKNIESKVKDILNIIEWVYEKEENNFRIKRDNLKRINADVLIKALKNKADKGEIKDEKDIISYIELILQD